LPLLEVGSEFPQPIRQTNSGSICLSKGLGKVLVAADGNTYHLHDQSTTWNI
jgi:hypothetical protein